MTLAKETIADSNQPKGVPPASLRRLSWEDFPPPLAEALQPRVARLGYLGEFFRCCAHQPAALLDFIRFTESSKSGLPERLVELIALTAATHFGNDYERHQHEQLALRLGFGADWIAAVEDLATDSNALAQDESIVRRAVLSILADHGHGAAGPFQALASALGDAAAIAVLMVLGRYMVHAVIVNTLALEPPVPSIFAAVKA